MDPFSCNSYFSKQEGKVGVLKLNFMSPETEGARSPIV